MAGSVVSTQRVTVDGKFFRQGDKKFFLKGVTYGPFAPNEHNEMFPSREQTRRDFAQILTLGANVLRLYYVPPRWFLDLAEEHQLKVLIDVPWPKHLCFLDSRQSQEAARQAVRSAVQDTKGHPAVLGYSVVNEISAEVIRWSGVRRTEKFIDELVQEAKSIDPRCLCTFTSYPPTEFLQPSAIDFVCFNVYLHDPKAYAAYLARLQTLADYRPLVLGEFGMDSIRQGEAHKSEFLAWQIEGAFRGGLAGTVVFSYTDDWFRGGLQIEDWAFGLTTRDRQPKDSFRAVQQQYRQAPYFPLSRNPKVSVVVATYNGSRTLKACLESLQRLNYPDYEIILIDDGSTDSTPEIARPFPGVRYIRQENRGLSAARNAGIAAATGEIIAFTDDDCRADEDWLYYLVGDLTRSDFVGIGGHNFLPPEDSWVAAAVLVSPGGPAHVMLTDREAEHIPGCNMAFYKWALDSIRGFEPVFRKAGDDVDVCWRLQERNYSIGFSPAGFVWHYRRPTVKAYLKQQAGYGEAEALLRQKHPEYFNSFGGGIWHGRIYNAAKSGVVVGRPVIYHGLFGSGFFQRLYEPDPALALMLCASLGYHVFVTLPLFLLSAYVEFFFPVAVASFLVSCGVCIVAAAQARLPHEKQRLWSRPLIALMFFLQPIVRGWSRFKTRMHLRPFRGSTAPDRNYAPGHGEDATNIAYWSKGAVDRYQFLSALQKKLETQFWMVEPDTGWDTHDFQIFGGGWSSLRITTVTETLEQGKLNFRCRLQGAWQLRAKLLFWIVCLVEVLLVATLARNVPWLWLLLTLLPLVYWFLMEETIGLQQVILDIMDDVAAEQELVRLPAN